MESQKPRRLCHQDPDDAMSCPPFIPVDFSGKGISRPGATPANESSDDARIGAHSRGNRGKTLEGHLCRWQRFCPGRVCEKK